MSLPSIDSAAETFDAHALLVRGADGQLRAATGAEVLQHARRVLRHRVRRGATMTCPQAVKDYLCVQIGALEQRCSACCFWTPSIASWL